MIHSGARRTARSFRPQRTQAGSVVTHFAFRSRNFRCFVLGKVQPSQREQVLIGNGFPLLKRKSIMDAPETGG